MISQNSITNILFPTDFSELSARALATAIAICKRHGAVLHVLHVVETRFLMIPRDAYHSAVYTMPKIEQSVRDKLVKLVEEIDEKHDIKTKMHLEWGNPAEIIGIKANDLGCELIAMGTHGASGFREFFIGSNSYAVIKNTGIPVLTIPGKKVVTDFKRILLPVRNTKNLMERYEFIEPIIEKNKAELFIAGLSLPGEDNKLGPLNEDIRELGKSLRTNHTRFKSENFTCRNYAKKVLELAKKEKADMIVITASLDYSWKQFFVGPYVQQVVNHARIPVLSLRLDDVKPELANNQVEENTSSAPFQLAF